ncbi:uncharacterized protein LOC131997206 [Stomoxys calcitrans]|uniref:uncharacterized protein LOC131997206 n=1 Tax=Stomoxys calcitrans TaxID=35570 RepID=UPI0027E305AC|nr:uncharacterized protein LOC131997206 [Stomoxys calcitrans]
MASLANHYTRDLTANMIRILAGQRSGLKICHINAQSLNNKIDEFRFIFENSGLDAICVSETWLKETTPDSFIDLVGYTVYRADRPRRGGGTAIYARDNLRTRICARSVADDSIEYVFIELSATERKLLLGCVYRPNNNIDIQPFLEVVEHLTITYPDVIIAGDLNSNILLDSSLTAQMSSLGLLPFNTSMPTHFSSSSSTLLDLFFVSEISKVSLYDQLSASCFSNHDLIFLSYNFEILGREESYSYRDFNCLDHEALPSLISDIDWSLLYRMESIDDQVNFLSRNVCAVQDFVLPIKMRQICSKTKPWFSADIRVAIESRNTAYRRWKRFRTSHLREEYRSNRSRVNKLIRAAKINYYLRRFTSAIGSRKTWKTIHDIGIGRRSPDNITDVDVDQLNATFTNIPTNPIDPSFYDFELTLGDRHSEGFEFSGIEQNDVVLGFSMVKSNAVGFDGIEPRFLKHFDQKFISGGMEVR